MCIRDRGTVVYVALDGVYCGYIVIADSIKNEAFEAIKNLKKVGVRRTVMLTGAKTEVGLSLIHIWSREIWICSPTVCTALHRQGM